MMKKIKNIKAILCLLMLCSSMAAVSQQAGMTIQGLSGQNMTVTGSTLFFPPGAYFNSTGNNYVAVDRLIAGAAGTTITGTPGSRLHLLSANQLDPASSAIATQVDANGVAFNLNITSYNPLNLLLIDQAFGTVTANAQADIVTGGQFAFGTQHPLTLAPVSDNHIVTNSNRFIVDVNGTLTGFDVNRYIVTNDNSGELRKLGLTTGQNFFFPIGRAEADYTPANMQVASAGPVDYYMNVRNFAESIPDENIGGYSGLPNVSRTWTIYGSNAGSTANMDFIHPGTATYEANGYDRSNSNVIRFTGTTWNPNLPNDAENEALFGTPTNYWAQQIQFAVPSSVGANSFYGKSNALAPLPVRLGEFIASAAGCVAQLKWSTISEQNTAFISVERNYKGLAGFWENVTTIPAAGFSNTVKLYSATDTRVSGDAAYYRLVITDADGKVSYSPVRYVRFNCGKSIVVYPNPVNDFVNIVLPSLQPVYSLRLMNADGKLVMPAIQKASGTIKIQMAQLPKGSYVLIAEDGSGEKISTVLIKN